MFVSLTLLFACSPGLGPGPIWEPVDVSFTAPDGFERSEELFLFIEHFDGSNCTPATWYETGDPDFVVKFAVPDEGGSSVFDDGETSIANWLPNETSDATRLYLHGGIGTALSADSSHLAYEITGGEIRYWDHVNDADIACAQTEPMTIRLDGDFDTFEPNEDEGAGTLATGDDGTPLCGDS